MREDLFSTYSLKIIDYKRVIIQYKSVIDEELLQHIRKLVTYLTDHYDRSDKKVEVFHTYTEIAIQFLNTPLSIKKEVAKIDEILESGVLANKVSDEIESANFKIPVCYQQPFAKDVAEVAKMNQLSEEKVIELHHQPIYRVYFIGFLPGFPYLGGLNQQICAPRKEKARSKISKGDVGIAGCQTGIYSVDSPGGWQIIGNTPIDLVQLNDKVNTVLKSGDTISFYPIPKAKHEELKNSNKKVDLTAEI
mgnify:CR=1 FL=1